MKTNHSTHETARPPETADQSELAVQWLDAAARHMEPVFAETRARFLGSLTQTGMAYDALQHETSDRKANKAEIEQVCGLFPIASVELKTNSLLYPEHYRVFGSHDPYTARLIRSLTVWDLPAYKHSYISRREARETSRHEFIPYYVIGSSQKDETWTSVVLASARAGREFQLKQAVVNNKDWATLQSLQKDRLAAEATSQEVEEVFDEKYQQLLITPWTPGIIQIQDRKIRAKRASDIAESNRIPAVTDDEFRFGMTAEEMVEYSVYDYLTTLAAAFDKIDEMKEVVENNQRRLAVSRSSV